MYSRLDAPRSCPSIRTADGESGTVLIWALFFVSLTTGVLIAHSIEMSANRRLMDTRYRRIDVADHVAASGLTDATAYLRCQPVQPVATFAPQLDPLAEPPLNETIDPTVGLVREFEVKGKLWGRYEVRHTEATDVSTNYGQAAGSVWDLGSRGYLFERTDPNRRFDEAPNRVLSTRTVFTEVRGVPLTVPAMSAIVVTNPNQVEMLGNSAVDGKGGPAVAYKKPAGPVALPTFDAAIVGTPTAVSVIGLDLSVPAIFGMREDRLINLADITLVSPRQLRGRVVEDQFVYVPGDLILDPTTLSLRGRMLLVVNGNLTAGTDNNSDFRGVVYVKGITTIEGPFSFAGTLVAGGAVKIGGSPDLVRVEASPSDVLALQTAMSRYRVSRDKRPGAISGGFAAPSDLAAVR